MKYDILVIDPPWSYNNKKTGGSLKSGSQQHYETMTSYDIKHTIMDYTDRKQLMNENSLCFLWTTNSFMRDAIDIMNCWGYKEKTIITWVKRNYGLGSWFRGKTEHCLFGVRGKIKALRINMPNVIISDKVMKHSEKPEEFYKYVATVATEYTVNHKKCATNILELFARKSRDYYCYMNWHSIGKEITGNDIRKDLQSIVLK